MKPELEEVPLDEDGNPDWLNAIRGGKEKQEKFDALPDEQKSERKAKAKRGHIEAQAHDIRRVVEADSMEPADHQKRNAPEGTFDDDIPTEKAGEVKRRRRFSTVLDKYLAAWERDEKQGINPNQHSAGEIFTEDYLAATKSIGARRLDMVSGGGNFEAVNQAHEAVMRAFRAMAKGKAGKIGAAVVERVCAHDEGCVYVEQSFDWPRNVAMVRLREGLDDLVKHYGIATR